MFDQNLFDRLVEHEWKFWTHFEKHAYGSHPPIEMMKFHLEMMGFVFSKYEASIWNRKIEIEMLVTCEDCVYHTTYIFNEE